ncbi:MAG: hypothetical protein RL136_1328 [Planctomycetota bacterium]|jgi:CubicO group peptidase (beta-lactamase class C family)
MQPAHHRRSVRLAAPLLSATAIAFAACSARESTPPSDAASLQPANDRPIDERSARRAEPDLSAADAYSAEHEGDGVLILQHGAEVHAAFRSGFSAATPHLLASGTKSFSGIAAALAAADGLLDLDERVSDTIEEWRADDGKRDITVRQLLSLAAGLESLSARIDSARSARAAGITDRAHASIDARLVAPPGTRFIYGPSSFYVFGELMRRKFAAAGSDADVVAYLEQRVFRPLGIAPRFMRDEAGNANLPGGCRMSARDWAVFGEMVRRGGVHVDATGREIRILDEARLAELLRPHGPNASYGLTWWLLRSGAPSPEDALGADLLADRVEAGGNGPIRRALRDRLRARAEREHAEEARHAGADPRPEVIGYMAAGKGKQRLYIVPEHGLTIVRFGAIDGGRDFDDARFLELVLTGLGLPGGTGGSGSSGVE